MTAATGACTGPGVQVLRNPEHTPLLSSGPPPTREGRTLRGQLPPREEARSHLSITSCVTPGATKHPCREERECRAAPLMGRTHARKRRQAPGRIRPHWESVNLHRPTMTTRVLHSLSELNPSSLPDQPHV